MLGPQHRERLAGQDRAHGAFRHRRPERRRRRRDQLRRRRDRRVRLEQHPQHDLELAAHRRAPAGGFQHSPRRLRSASISLCDSCAARPSDLPSEGVGLKRRRRPRPAAAARACRAAPRSWSGRTAAAAWLAAAAAFALAFSSAFFFASSFFKVSAIGSIFGGSFFSGLASAGFGAGCSAGGGGASVLAAVELFLLHDLGRRIPRPASARRPSRPAAAGGLSLARSSRPW